ncbi:MAG TPA: 1-acyl-sn-glycerol-3-phosphate acyltransferase [Candidatus Eisenbacteria bacterium]
MADRVAAPAYLVARMVLGTAARVYFRRIEVRHADRVPGCGPLLVIANHPASFTDVIVLSLALRRRLHFLAMAPIFKPWIRGLGLRLCGTLPVYRREDDPGKMARNDDTFRACHEILDHGGAVLIFPEGTTQTDRRIVQVKTGAARLALGRAAGSGERRALNVLPVGLHFADRTRFQSDVSVSVGRAIDLDPFRERARQDEAAAVRELTAHIQAVLEKLIVNIPEQDRVALVAAVERLYREEARPHAAGAPDVGIARGIAATVDYFARSDPDRIAGAWERIRHYEGRLAALRIQDATVREMLPLEGRIRERARLVIIGVLGIVPALVGAIVHYVPYRLSGAAARWTPDPTQVAATRIAVAVVLFPLAYAALAAGLWRGLGWSPHAVALALGLLLILGLHALAYLRWLAQQRRRIRLVFMKASHRRLVARLRRERRALIELFDRARREYEAARGPEAVPS